MIIYYMSEYKSDLIIFNFIWTSFFIFLLIIRDHGFVNCFKPHHVYNIFINRLKIKILNTKFNMIYKYEFIISNFYNSKISYNKLNVNLANNIAINK